MSSTGRVYGSICFEGTQKVSPLEEEKSGMLVEEGANAIWSVSSCKPGYGVHNLRDNSIDTLWQSDGPQPHLVNVQFLRKTLISEVAIYVNYRLDESYTPSKISVRSGSHWNDLFEVELVDLKDTVGWVLIPLSDANSLPLRTFLLQIAVLSNHQNGRDSHIRQIKLYSYRHCRNDLPDLAMASLLAYRRRDDAALISDPFRIS